MRKLVAGKARPEKPPGNYGAAILLCAVIVQKSVAAQQTEASIAHLRARLSQMKISLIDVLDQKP